MNGTLALVRGNPASLSSLLAQLHPSRGVYTAVARHEDNSSPMIGQVTYVEGERSANLSFLMAPSGLDESTAALLLENLVIQAGTWGAANVLAAVDESQEIFTSLRRVGFAVYSRQTVWQIPPLKRSGSGTSSEWSEPTPVDSEPVYRLCQSLLPPLVQGAEEMSTYCPKGLVVRRDDQVLAYTQVLSGPQGVCLQPLFHPQVTDVRELLRGLVNQLQGMFLTPLERPIYCLVRSYQAGLASILQEFDAKMLGEQALLVKHLAVRQRQPLQEIHFSAIDRKVRSTSPMVHQVTLPEKTDLK